MPSLKTLLSDTMRLFFPHHCMGCGSDIISKENYLCLRCVSELPHTGFESIAANPIENIFRGRIDIEAATAQFYFSKGHLIQFLIHQLKYKGSKDAGEYLGTIMGKSILESGRFTNIDYLIPLPLYPEKEFKRGYNQAEIICNGMANVMGIPVHSNNLVRKRATETQTKKHRAERWQNVDGSFSVNTPQKLHGKNLLLVDDVITTGATLEACGAVLTNIPSVKLSLATLAMASK